MRLHRSAALAGLVAALVTACTGEGPGAPPSPAASSAAPARDKAAAQNPPRPGRYPRVPLRVGRERVPLVVLPGDASVEVNGELAHRRDGVIDLVGELDSTHRVVVIGATDTKPKAVDVIIRRNAQGRMSAQPEEIDLNAPAPPGPSTRRAWEPARVPD
jgi:hypothetical protein